MAQDVQVCGLVNEALDLVSDSRTLWMVFPASADIVLWRSEQDSLDVLEVVVLPVSQLQLSESNDCASSEENRVGFFFSFFFLLRDGFRLSSFERATDNFSLA